MLKKTLLAVSIAALAAPAMADIDLTYKAADINTTQLASVTKQPVLSFSTAEETVAASFNTDGDLKQNGFITIELTGDATFNDNEVRQWLTGTDAQGSGINVSAKVATAEVVWNAGSSSYSLTNRTTSANTTLDKVFKLLPATGSEYQIDYAIDNNGQRLRLALAQTLNSYNDMIRLGYTDAVVLATVDGAAVKVAALKADLPAGVEAEITAAGGDFADISGGTAYDAATDVQRATFVKNYVAESLTNAYLNSVAAPTLEARSGNGANNGEIVLAAYNTAPASDADIKTNSTVGFDFANANQIFNLKSGQSVAVAAKIGALKNASYSADPVPTGALFKLGDLFALQYDDGVNTNGPASATALVAESFKKWDIDGDGVYDEASDNIDLTSTGLELVNKTTNQNIQLNKVNLTLSGDFAPFKMNSTTRELQDKGGNGLGWKVSADYKSATVVAGNTVLAGSAEQALGAFTKIYVEQEGDKANSTPIEAQTVSITATIKGADQDTFEDFSHKLAELFIITRDGLKFDTVLTGTTSSNTVHIRDVSGILPEDGGSIFVTVWEYDAHEAGENAERNVLADRKELSVKLPANGAVTLSPATIAEQLGIEVAPARQARMLFEVETNLGEVAVKKSDGKGTDIQVGSQAEVKKIVDFTL
ncbi:TPA: cell surface protein [Vibrio vulnificus]|nr:cell surface protein [Vibrio vulnificus]HDY8208298.1 cell surface protein [Vibrio vulnificus]